MPIMREKYFYTVLFLDDYNPIRDKSTTKPEQYHVEAPQLKSFEITENSDSESIKWFNYEDGTKKLYIRHNLQLPVTLEMWNSEGTPIFYCPILKEGVSSISLGKIIIENSRSLNLYFEKDAETPKGDEKFILNIKTLPDFDTKSERFQSNDVATVKHALDEMLDAEQMGLAIVFRRNSLDAHFDLICDFDESYLHSLAEGVDLQYLTRKSKFQQVKWLTKYTDNLQDVLDEINTRYYEVKFSWKENGTQWWNNDPFNYQHKLGHL